MLPLAYGTLLLGLALVKATEFWKLNGIHDSRLVIVLIKDQVQYFMLYVANPLVDGTGMIVMFD